MPINKHFLKSMWKSGMTFFPPTFSGFGSDPATDGATGWMLLRLCVSIACPHQSDDVYYRIFNSIQSFLVRIKGVGMKPPSLPGTNWEKCVLFCHFRPLITSFKRIDWAAEPSLPVSQQPLRSFIIFVFTQFSFLQPLAWICKLNPTNTDTITAKRFSHVSSKASRLSSDCSRPAALVI